MTDWQERITRDTRPAIRIEHALRYAAAAPIVAAAPAWCDLGCGSGVAAADALGDAELGRVVLVDTDTDALETAGRDLQAREVVRLAADLATEEGVRAARDAIGEEPVAVTCFEAIEHLETFVPLVAALVEIANTGGTVVLSVPNDAFWALENPYHRTMWGEGAFEELRRLLPSGTVVARQVPLAASHVVVEGGAVRVDVPAVEVRDDAVPSHFLCAFGAHADLLTSRALARPADLDGQRRWERQRESNLALMENEIAELRQWVADLERRLGERTPAA
jgi:2-polyprenyl-3-methyl-5-hydroxy-6-metoxy-1,4-benzoquinol methylase